MLKIKNKLQLGISGILAIIIAFSIHYARASIPVSVGANPISPQFVSDTTGVWDAGLTVSTYTDGWDGCNILLFNNSTPFLASVSAQIFEVLADGTSHAISGSTVVTNDGWQQFIIGRSEIGGVNGVVTFPGSSSTAANGTILGGGVPMKIEVVGGTAAGGNWRFVFLCGP
jgi:hypothetical protein